MTSPTATGLVGERLAVMETRSDTPEQVKSRTDILSDELRSRPSVECETTRDDRGALSPARLTAESNGRTTNIPVDGHCDTEQRIPSEERRGTNGEHNNACLVSNALSISEDLKSILDKKDSELERLRLVHQKALSARDRQIRSLQADIDSLTSQLSDRMRQVQVVQEANQLKDQHIDLLKNIVKDLQTKITSPKHTSMRSSRETTEDLKSQIRKKDEELAMAESKIAELRKQLELTLSPTDSVDTTPLARVQDDGVAAPLEQKVELPDNAELPPLSPTQFHCQQPQQLPNACTSSPRSWTETDGSGTRVNASSQTSPDTVQESMSEVMTQLARTRDLLAATEEDLKHSVDLADKLNRELKSQRNFCLQQEKLIDDLKVEMRSKNAQLLDNSIQCLQAAISEKDSSIARLEMQGTASLKNRSCIHNLKQEKSKLMKELKEKMEQKINLLHLVMEEDEAEQARVSQNSSQEYSLEEVCEAIRVLEQSKSQLRGYIDQLLALVLDRDPSLLEGLPRIQQNNGMSPDLLRVASLPELLLELREDEEDMYSLRSYTALLLQKISEYSPDLLKCVDELCLSS